MPSHNFFTGFRDGFLAKLEAHSLCDSRQYRYTIYTTKSSNNTPLYGLGAKGVAYRVSVFSLNVSKPSDLALSFTSTVCTIKSQFASKLAVGFQNILRKNPLPVVSLVSPRGMCLGIEGGTKPACNQWRLLVSNPGGYIMYARTYQNSSPALETAPFQSEELFNILLRNYK